MRKDKTRILAMGGVFCAMAVVLLLLGALIPVGVISAPVFAGIVLAPIAIEAGGKWALLSYAAVGALSLLLIPDAELSLLFIALFGWYPIAQPFFLRLRRPVFRCAAKLLLFNAAVAAVYALLFFLLAPGALRGEFAGLGPALTAALPILANLTFLLYDRLLTLLRPVYFGRIRRHIFK